MNTFVQPTMTSFTALDLLLWHEQGALVLSPKFQRRSVWKPVARSSFIDSLLRSYPVPPIHIRTGQSASGRSVIREVVDGQQRLRALFDYVSDRFSVSRVLDSPWRSKTYSQLDPADQLALRLYKFQVYQYDVAPDELILEIFARMNAYSVSLNAQELRNGKYFGEFKQAAYALALEHLAWWRAAGIFSEAAIARMNEAELTSELLVFQLDGLQDKKTSIDAFYSRLDEQWPDAAPSEWGKAPRRHPSNWMGRRQAEDRFRHTMQVIAESVGDIIAGSEFRRVPLFYSLFCAVYLLLYGGPDGPADSRQGQLSSTRSRGLRTAVEELSSLLADNRQEVNATTSSLPNADRQFVLASLRQTDNIMPRRVRLEAILARTTIAS